MEFTQSLLEEYITRWGEVFVVLDSDREYKIHGTESLKFYYRNGSKVVQAEGLHDGEWLKVEFPLDAIEHVYTHKEV